jgi:ribulose kinase
MAPRADGSVRGGFVGVSLDSERVDLVRAAAEGVAHNLRWVLGPVEAVSGEAATDVVLTGGAARSPGWAQIVADVLARPVRTLARPHHAGASAVAAWAVNAVDAGRGAGGPVAGGGVTTDPDDGDRPGLGTRWAEHYAPDPTTEAIHDHAHGQFVAAFDALRPLRLGSPR